MGRTGSSWGKIGAFYVVYFAFLAAWFAVMLTAFYQTLDTEHMPTYSPGKEGGSILQNIAMGYRPLAPVDNIESTLIWYDHKEYNEKDPHRVTHWIDNLDAFVAPYKTNLTSVKYIDCEHQKPNHAANEVCDFKLSEFGSNCNSENKWGYTKQQPCVLLKLNKMINWEPEVYTTMEEVNKEGDMPQSLKDHIQAQTKLNNGTMPEMIWVSCVGKYAPDADEMGKIELLPQQGFQKRYFPYTNVKGYRAPLVAVWFENPKKSVVINIECRAWAKNIKQNRQKRFGLIDFELLLD